MTDHRKMNRAAALERFERAVELPLILLALAMIPLLIVPFVVDLPSGVAEGADAIGWFIWAAFAFEYVVRLTLTQNRLRFILREWPDLVIILLPFLRPLRIVRSARALRLLRLARLVAVLGELEQEAKQLFVRHHLHYAILVTMVVVVACAALAMAAEDGSGGSIDSFGDAIWWAITTITTVGYGDTFPTTSAGRGVGVLLMLAGVTSFGIISANLAAFMLESAPEKVAEEPQPSNAELLARIEALAEDVRELKRSSLD